MMVGRCFMLEVLLLFSLFAHSFGLAQDAGQEIITSEDVVTVQPTGTNTDVVRITSIVTATRSSITIRTQVTGSATTVSASVTATPTPSPKAATSTKSSTPSKTVLVAASVGGAVVLVAAIMGIYFCCRKIRRRREQDAIPVTDQFFTPRPHFPEPTVPVLPPTPTKSSAERNSQAFPPMTERDRYSVGPGSEHTNSMGDRHKEANTLPQELHAGGGNGPPSVPGTYRTPGGRPIGYRSPEMHLWHGERQYSSSPPPAEIGDSERPRANELEGPPRVPRHELP